MEVSSSDKAGDVWTAIRKELNFYRVHLLYFSFTPLIFSGIFYASNGEFHISYIDSLFNCVSAMCVCGLAVNDLSSLTPWQQTILFIQMCMGSPVAVSWVVVYIRRHYFARAFDRAGKTALRKAQKRARDAEAANRPLSRRLTGLFSRGGTVTVVEEDEDDISSEKKKGLGGRLGTHMIRRVDDAPKLVDPSGWISEGRRESVSQHDPHRHLGFTKLPEIQFDDMQDQGPTRSRSRPVRRLSDPGTPTLRPDSAPMKRFLTINDTDDLPDEIKPAETPRVPMHKTQTVEFAPNAIRRRRDNSVARPRGYSRGSDDTRLPRFGPRGIPLEPKFTMTTQGPSIIHSTKHSGFGGFPMPHELIRAGINKLFPKLHRRLTRTWTMPRTMTIASQRGDSIPPGSKTVPYISFNATVGRNSEFHLLTNEQMEEIGGVEFRALNALLWIIPAYHITVQIVGYVIVAPYISTGRWSSIFLPPQQHRALASPWFALFQVVSAYTNTGMSLVDQSMVPFQHATVMILVIVFLILAGNTAYPIFLRFSIWLMSKVVRTGSRLNETLHFLLDHPRRCYILLFPSHQTWFLLSVVIGLNFTDWFFFLLLDIGNPLMEAIPLGTRFLAGLLQGVAVRAAGFGIVSLSSLAPAVKVLYVMMMYVSVYPIAMSVRSTNVYEEKSLGVYNEDDMSEGNMDLTGNRMAIWSRYLGLHARRQLSFDMWWLGLSLFLVCIIERGNIDNEENYSWFTIFHIIFELVSAYGTVGLSLGLPSANYSFSGAFHTLSKLVVCFVMIRGRHRGLPVAIDRAVTLPPDLFGDKTDRGSMYVPDMTEENTVSGMDTRSLASRPAPSNLPDIRENPNSTSPSPDLANTQLPRNGDFLPDDRTSQ